MQVFFISNLIFILIIYIFFQEVKFLKVRI